MGTYTKYEFNKIPNGILNLKNADVIICPRVVEVEGVYDSAMNQITPPVYSDKVYVDIYWHNKPENINEPKRIFPNSPNHFIAGLEDKYREDLTNYYLEK